MAVSKDFIEKVRKKVKDPDAVIDLMDMCFVWVSQKSADIVKCERSELVGVTFTDFSGIDAFSTQIEVSKVIGGGEIREVQIKDSEGSIIKKTMRYTPLSLEKDHPQYLIVEILD